jgi:hypothetical protein
MTALMGSIDSTQITYSGVASPTEQLGCLTDQPTLHNNAIFLFLRIGSIEDRHPADDLHEFR